MEEMTEAEKAAMEAMKTGKPFEEAETPEEFAQEVEAEAAEQAAAEPKPEQEAEAPAEEKAERPPEGYVPHGALHQERERRKALEERLKALEERIAQPAEEKPAGPEPMPDPVMDPDGFTGWYAKQSEATQAEVREIRQQMATQQRQQQLASRVQQDEASFRAERPDYDIANAAVTSGRSAAQMAYEIAQARGYAPAAADPAPDPAKRIGAQAKAQAATQSLSHAAGPANAGGVTAEDIAKMSEQDFAELKAKDPDAIRRALGG